MTNEQTPSADYIPTAEEWKQMQREYHERCEEVSALAIQLEQLKAPSATVDEPKHLSSEQRQKLFNFLLDSFEIHLLEDEFNTIESIVFPITYPYTLKDSQQPSVDVDAIVNKLTDAVQDNLTGYDYDYDEEQTIKDFKFILQEALRGSYSREEMKKAYSDGETNMAGLEYEGLHAHDVSASEYMDKYDAERGK